MAEEERQEKIEAKRVADEKAAAAAAREKAEAEAAEAARVAEEERQEKIEAKRIADEKAAAAAAAAARVAEEKAKLGKEVISRLSLFVGRVGHACTCLVRIDSSLSLPDIPPCRSPRPSSCS